jgi:hypothetical protein
MSRPRRCRVPRLTIVFMTLFVVASGVLTLAQRGTCTRRDGTFLVAAPNVCRRVPSLSLVDPFAQARQARSRALTLRRDGAH